MPVKQLQEYLNRNNVKYTLTTHSTAYTAQEIAALAHIKGRHLAKTVMLKLDGSLAMAVVPAAYQVDLARLMEISGASDAELATENEFRTRFPGCETGAMPPFGNLFDIPVYVDTSVAQDEEIAFNAGSHHELLRMSYADFACLVGPEIGSFRTEKACAHGVRHVLAHAG